MRAASLVAVVASLVVSCSDGRKTSDRGTSSGPGSIGAITHAIQQNGIFGTSLPAKTLSLTFDDGPSTRTLELSAYLHAQGIRGTFFVNGARIAPTTLPNPNNITVLPGVDGILAGLVADGHIVANHTVTHRDLVTTVLPTGNAKLVQELSETDDDIAPYVPFGRFLFRPPYFSYNAAVASALQASPMNKYVGPVAADEGGISDAYPTKAADWACWQGSLYSGAALANGTGYATTVQCGDAYLTEIAQVGRGIVLMHEPYSWANGNTVDMVRYIVPILKAQGYTFVGLDEVPAIAALLPPVCDPTCATCTGTGANQCASCATGRYLRAGACEACSSCVAGTYETVACSPLANTACAACDASCMTCNAAGPNACLRCPATTYLDAGTCRRCSACSVGAFETFSCSPTSDTVCAPCHSTCQTCTGPTAQECGSCPVGTFLTASRCQACANCGPGTFLEKACTATTDATCSACPAGTESATIGAKSCTPCAAGTSQGRAGQSNCVSCAPGTISTVGAISCADCAANTFAAMAGQTTCAPCPPNTFAAPGASACTPKPAPAPAPAPAADSGVDASVPTNGEPSTADESGCSVSSSRPSTDSSRRSGWAATCVASMLALRIATRRRRAA